MGASSYTGDRGALYTVYEGYVAALRKGTGYFDDSSRVLNLHRLLSANQGVGALVAAMAQRAPRGKPLLQRIASAFVDEVQDLTVAEVLLLARCLDNPDRLFLAGDSAQAIFGGVAFSFSEVKALLHRLSQPQLSTPSPPRPRKAAASAAVSTAVRVPLWPPPAPPPPPPAPLLHAPMHAKSLRLKHLLLNWRTGGGLLRAPSALLAALNVLFSRSEEGELGGDKGVFNSPPPLLILDPDCAALLTLLQAAHERSADGVIYFAPDEAIIVRDEDTKALLAALPELRGAPIWTIYEVGPGRCSHLLLRVVAHGSTQHNNPAPPNRVRALSSRRCCSSTFSPHRARS